MRDSRRYEQILADYEEADRIERAQLRLWDRWHLRTLAMDASNLPNVRGARTRTFYGIKQTAAVTATGWQVFNIPRNASFVSIVCLGAASGGGGGFTGLNASARGGGGGGASGAMARAIFPAEVLPRELFVLAGNGGSGATGSGVAGTVGSRSVVADRPNTLGTTANTILVSGAAAATGGVAGTSAGGQVGGTAETIATNALGAYMGWALSLVFIAGTVGAGAGILGNAGSSSAFGSVGLPVTGGGGGGSVTTTNTDVAGGGVTGNGIMTTVPGGLAAAGAGGNGYLLQRPFLSMGGGGGGTAGVSGTAGAGGKAAYGSGGGGGGSGVTGGAGGDGGNGLVMIAWW